MTKKQMSPDELKKRGRELIRLAKQKENDLRQRKLFEIGKIIKREIDNGWPTSWDSLRSELESITGSKVETPSWVIKPQISLSQEGE